MTIPIASSAKSTLTPAELKARVRGPIVSIPTPFTADFAVDYDAIRRIVKLGLDHGIVAYELTAGDSQYHALSYDEIKQLTRVLVAAVGGKGIAIGATGAWWTGRAVDYARYAESVGADGIQVLIPRGSDPGFVEHYRKIAAATRIGIILQGNISLPLLEQLVGIESIVAMKEDVSEKYYFDIARKFGRRLSIFCGGQKWRFLVGRPYGSTGYLSTFGTFAPTIATRFWQAVERNDMTQAYEIVLKYDQPLFDFCLAGPRSFNAYWHAILEHFKVASRYLRPPEESCSDADMRRVKTLCDSLGLGSG
jgi:4-hydroxy-tetrahydrodipicolinate synthase